MKLEKTKIASYTYETEKQLIKENIIRIADHHREHCSGADCNISLHLLSRVLDLANITMTSTERRKLM